MTPPRPEAIIAITASGYVNLPWLTLDNVSAGVGLLVAVSMFIMTYSKHRLEMKVLKSKLNPKPGVDDHGQAHSE